MLGIILGAGFGLVIGVGRDLLNRKLVSDADLEEYQLPFNAIHLKRKTKDDVLLASDKVKMLIPEVLADLEERAKDNKVKVIGVTKLGNKELDEIINNFADNRNESNLKTLVIDLNVEEPFVQGLYDINTDVNITNVLTNDNVAPIKVKDNLDVLPAVKYEYPARFLKEDKLSEALNKYREEYEYIFIELPAKDFYPAILFSYGLLDSLVIKDRKSVV